MVSTGQDMKMAVWDVRNFKPVHEYFLRRPGASVAISDRNLTGLFQGDLPPLDDIFDLNDIQIAAKNTLSAKHYGLSLTPLVRRGLTSSQRRIGPAR